MKVYALGYEQINGTFFFYAYTDKFLSQRQAISEDLYEEFKARFTLAHRNNKSLSGMYFMPEL